MKSSVILFVFVVFLMVFMIGGVSAKFVVVDSNKSERILNDNVKWIEDRDIKSLNKLNIESDSLFPENTEIARVYYIYNISCEEEAWHDIKITFGDLWNPERIMRLDYSGADAADSLLYYCKIISDIDFTKTNYFTSWNLPEFQYGDDYYRGYVYGSEKCYNWSDGTISCSQIMTLDFVSYSNPHKKLRGNILIALFINGTNIKLYDWSYAMGWFIVEDDKKLFDYHEEKISTLESWKTTITDTISSIWLSITGHTTRIEALENKNYTCTSCGNASSNSEYFKYLSYSDRKNIVCGYAEDNHLTSLIDLNANCTITYRQTSRGETASCRCIKI